jgi:NADPH:quinone reductase-like Zn-dependent oxidoreductase
MLRFLVVLPLAVAAVVQNPAAPTMKAVRIHDFGGPEVLKLDDVARPVAAKGEVLVKVTAAGVNPVDWKVREGGLKSLRPDLPQILGYDVAGVVEALGPGVERFKVGDQVFAYLSLTRGGGYAEYAAVPEGELALAPKKLDLNGAAAVPLAALTAWQALFDTAKLAEGQSVLIHAGSGGVGHFAIQLAKARGAQVFATSSEKNLAFLKELGADVAIDYRAQRFEEVAKDIDVVLETQGGDTLERSYGVLKPGGFLVSIVGAPPKAELEKRGLRGACILVRPNGKQLAELAAWIDAGKVKPTVSEVIPLAEAKRAHELSAAGHVRGKLVLRVAP